MGTPHALTDILNSTDKVPVTSQACSSPATPDKASLLTTQEGDKNLTNSREWVSKGGSEYKLMEQYSGNQGTFSAWHVASSTTSRDPSAPPSLASRGLQRKAEVVNTRPEASEGARGTPSLPGQQLKAPRPKSWQFKKVGKARVQAKKTRSEIAIKEMGRNNEKEILSPASIPKIEVNKTKIGSWK